VADDLERTEKPTPKRRKEGRDKGQVAVSTEVFTVANLLGVTLTLMLTGTSFIYMGISTFRRLWAPRNELDIEGAAELLRIGFGAAATVLMPILLAAAGSSILIGLVQTRGNISTHKLKPKASKLNPINNISRIIKKQAVIELPKSILKVLIVGGVIWFVIARHFEEYPGLSRLPLIQIVGFQMRVVLEAYLAGAVAMMFIAAIDYAYQYWQVAKSLKMTRTEIKEERRQSEGDPHVKAHLRSMQFQRSRTRMIEAVPKADVVVTNPEHISVALLYRRPEMGAPKVVAKGAGFLAHRIREIAQMAGVPILENRPLAQTLYRSVKVGQTIPERLYRAVAEVLSFVYRLDRRRARAW
jgi:flagellar biosynthetic protein FlhB